MTASRCGDRPRQLNTTLCRRCPGTCRCELGFIFPSRSANLPTSLSSPSCSPRSASQGILRIHGVGRLTTPSFTPLLRAIQPDPVVEWNNGCPAQGKWPRGATNEPIRGCSSIFRRRLHCHVILLENGNSHSTPSQSKNSETNRRPESALSNRCSQCKPQEAYILCTSLEFPPQSRISAPKTPYGIDTIATGSHPLDALSPP